MDTSINADTVYSDCYWTDDRRNAFREAVRAQRGKGKVDG